MAVILVLVIAVIVLVCFWDIIRNEMRRMAPGPIGLPFIGSTHLLIYHALWKQDTLQDIVANVLPVYGDVFEMRFLGIGHTIIVANPDDATHILATNFSNYNKPDHFKDLTAELFGQGIFAADGEQWRLQRKAASNAFRVADLRRGLHVSNCVAQQMGEFLRAQGETTPIDVQVFMQNCMLAIFSELAFGKSMSEISTKETVFAFHFNRLNGLISRRISNPLFRSMPWLQSEKDIRESQEYLRNVAQKMVDEARQLTPGQLEEHILGAFLRDSEASDEYLCDVLKNFLVAGRDTTSIAVAFCLHFLAKNQGSQNRLYEEIRHAGDPLLWDEADGHFKFLRAVINETLRLRPPVPIDLKMALEDDVLPSGIRVRKGTQIEWHQWTMSHNEKLFKNAKDFYPDRWFNPNLPMTNRPPFIPFQFGPRVCLGMRLAYVTMESVIISLVKNFKILPVENMEEPQVHFAITLMSVNGIHVRFQPRKN